MKNQPTFATRKQSTYQVTKQVISRLFVYIGLLAFCLVFFIGLINLASKAVAAMPALSAGSVITIVCTFMFGVCAWLAFRAYHNWTSCRLWVFSCVFFLVFGVQAFITRGGVS